jgi:bifunctional DNase/RNase
VIAGAAIPLLACPEAGEVREDVRVQVEGVGLDPNDSPVVLLAEVDGSRWLPIWIGTNEARAIARQIEAIETPRPDTHDLARRMLDGLQGELERVVVTDLRSGTYYATITLRSGTRRVEIDSRPSDAIAIALRTGSPIFVRERLLTSAGTSPAPASATGSAI